MLLVELSQKVISNQQNKQTKKKNLRYYECRKRTGRDKGINTVGGKLKMIGYYNKL